jgi:hypothetical protein
MLMKFLRILCCLLIWVISWENANASKYDKSINDVVCDKHAQEIEQEFKLPSGLLSAIAIAESRLWRPKLNKGVPWPWTLSISGKGYYLDNYEQALSKAKNALKRGKMVDLGCMQINHKYHHAQFNSVDEMLMPENNIRYSAKLLKKLYKRTGSWRTAIGGYHSFTKKNHEKYVKRIYKHWYQILATKLREESGKIANLINQGS